jgi:hypothetical protein
MRYLSSGFHKFFFTSCTLACVQQTFPLRIVKNLVDSVQSNAGLLLSDAGITNISSGTKTNGSVG